MFLSIGTALGVSSVVAVVLSWVFSRTIRTRIYSLECDVADLQDRHLRSVRKAGAIKRWDGEELLDGRIEELTTKAEVPKQKRWPKWGSSRNSSSEKHINEQP